MLPTQVEASDRHHRGPQNVRPGIDRFEGWRSVLAEAGLEPGPVALGDFTTRSGAAAVRELLASGIEFDATFAANDQMALGGYPVLREAGLLIPSDVAVIGFDDSPFSETSEPPLTTMSQPLQQFGQELVRLLLTMLEGSTPPHLSLLRASLIERGSV